MTEPKLSSDDARELFVDAIDGDLDPETRAAFDAALAADPELARDWEDLREALADTEALGEADEAASGSVDLLRGVQGKIRTRTGGRYYRDRFATDIGRPSQMWPLIAAIFMLVILGAAWFALYFAQEVG